jgi:hypothetical protein
LAILCHKPFDVKKEKIVNWKKTSFERQKLFDEVWATPVKTLAKKHGLSDVGLRKICIALDIPMPRRGYWAKLAAGKKVPKPPLHQTTAPTMYERVTNIVEVDEVLEERISKARGSTVDVAEPDRPDYTQPLAPTAFSPHAKLVLRSMKSTKIEEGAFSSLGVTWADISISPDLKERALLVVDRFAHELEMLGAKFENGHPPLPPVRRGMRRDTSRTRNCFTLHGQRFFIHIRERIKQELVPPPPPKPQKALRAGAREPVWEYRPPEYRYIPTGKMSASIVDAASYYESCRVEDTARGTIEDKIKKALQSVADSAIRRNVESEVRAERERARRKKAEEWEVAKANKDLLLAKLAEFEMAKDLDRAKSLRRLMKDVAANQATAPAELVSSLEQMAHMADWLDPLVKVPWPEVDAVGDRNPFKTLW